MYTIINETTRLVTHLSVTAEEMSLMEGFLFVPAEEVVCRVGQKLDSNTGFFHDHLLTADEFKQEHARVFSMSDIVILRHLEGSQILTPVVFNQWQLYRNELRSRFHNYEASPNYEWPMPPT